MTNASDLSAIVGDPAVGRGLRLRSDLAVPGWTYWELRNLNMHRVVGLLRSPRRYADPLDLETEIRSAISGSFRRAWWRGLACGVVVEVGASSWAPADLTPVIDIHENRTGVIQWLVLVADDTRAAIAMHTWESVFLSPVYRTILDGLTANGYRLTSAVKGKDGLMRLLTGVSDLEGVHFPEFRDQPGGGPR